ncbi:MAG: RDD family protein [Fibrobacteres bacterium]|nr:RDD family protein [Fibrobacterota bacterium]
METPSIQPTWRTASLWRRASAKILDLLFFVVVFYYPLELAIQATFRNKNIGPLAAMFLLYPILQAVFTWKWQASVGKRLLSISVVSLDNRRLDWVDALQRQVLPLAIVILLCLRYAELLPLIPPFPVGDPTPEEVQALWDKFQTISMTEPSRWLDLQQFSGLLFLGSLVLGIVRPDRRTLQDIWSGTMVVEPRRGFSQVV